jgi:hypothetical protein
LRKRLARLHRGIELLGKEIETAKVRDSINMVMAAASAEIENDDAKTAVLMMRPAGLLLRAIGLPP